MDGSVTLCEGCQQNVHWTIAQLRKLIHAYGRGEIERDAFLQLAGEVQLQHDMDVANRKLDAAMNTAMESGGSGAGRHRLVTDTTYQWPNNSPDDDTDCPNDRRACGCRERCEGHSQPSW